ncbi:MAG: hypothetical protein BWZ02_02151 [Lentisphaerae bacterium ADurb.BinA184]|nr:MAG: hypothetical protein BWZ02_02151 [Lentisphaerae bacterium ADurb.BinA184]
MQATGARKPPADRASPAGLRGFAAALGFLTIASQTVLLRELLMALYGSDMALAFTLASWTGLTGAGALLLGPRLARRRRLSPRAGLILYTLLVAGILLGVRRWAADEQFALRAYALIPAWLALPCLAGGALFAWAVGAATPAGRPPPTVEAYANEAWGGLAAGLAMTLYFRLGGQPVPALVALVAVAVGAARLSARPPRIPMRLGLAVLAGVALGVAASGVLNPLERASLARLRYPGARVLDHRSTPFGTLSALRRGEHILLYRNGLPCTTGEAGADRLVAAGVLAALPREWRTVAVHGALSAGSAAATGRWRGAEVQHWEDDPWFAAFVREWQPGGFPERLRTGTFPPAAWDRASPDLAVVFATEPGTLHDNGRLTREAFRRLAGRLAPAGVLAVVLPSPPGFIHPDHQRCLASIETAMADVFTHCRSWRTDLGVYILAGSPQPLPAGPGKLAERIGLAPALADSVRETLDYTPPMPTPPASGPGQAILANSAGRPAAYFAYLGFRGRMVTGASGWMGRLLRPMPGWVSLGLAGVALAVGRIAHRRRPGTALILWSGWMITLTLTYSLYAYQTAVGQAYWAAALLVAASLAGLMSGVQRPAFQGARALLPLVCLAPAVVFPLLPAAYGVGHAGLLGGLVVLNAGAGLCGGAVFRRGCALSTNVGGGAAVYAADLLGAAGGFLAGGVLMASWSGFDAAAMVCAGAALVNTLADRRILH